MIQTHTRITPNLWFDRQAADAAAFYTSVFPNSAIGATTYYGKEGFDIHGIPEGTVMTVDFVLDGQPFTALNGGPAFSFTEAISFMVHCATQDELDYYWDALSEGGDPDSQVCGWLKDPFGVSWQIVPADMTLWVSGTDQERTDRVMKAMFQMTKLDIAVLKKAYEG